MKEKKLKKSDEYITNRVMIALAAAAAFLLGVSRLFRGLDTPTKRAASLLICKWSVAVCAAVCVVGLVWYFVSVKKGTHKENSSFNGMFLAIAAFVAMCSLCIMLYDHLRGMTLVYIFVPASAVLLLIYSVYPREVFFPCLTHSYVAFALYAMSRLEAGSLKLVLLLSALAVCALSVLMFVLTAKNHGIIKIGGKSYVMFSRNAGKKAFIGLYGATAVLLIAAFLLPAALSFYAMFIVLAYIVISIIIATIKLM